MQTLSSKSLFFRTTAACLAVFICTAAYASDIKLEASVNRTQIYIGESFDLTVKVSGSSDRTQPDLSALKNCQIKFLGSHDSSRSSITIINGRMTRESFTGREFAYRVTPEKTGGFEAGPVTLTSGGKTISATTTRVNVAGIEAQDWVYVSISPSRESVLVDEPFEITLSILMKRLRKPFFDYDPMDPRDPPSLKIPYLEAPAIPGLDTPDINAILQNMLVTGQNDAGFLINDITLRNQWSFFDSLNKAQKAKFRLERRETNRNGIAFYEYILKLRYTPGEESSHTFGPVIFKGNVIIDVDHSGNGIEHPVFAVGNACTVRIVPPPEEGRPTSYIGAIGTGMKVEAELDTQTCNVNDPLTLTVTVAGNISMANIFPPTLERQKDLVEFFRIYEDNIQTASGPDWKKYMYIIRPKQAGTYELPPLELSYYDTNERTYKILKTKPIPLKANKVAELTQDLIINTAAASGSPKNGDPASPTDLVIAPMWIADDGHINEPSGLEPWQMIIVIAGPALYSITWLLINFIKSSRRRSHGRHLKKEMKLAISMIEAAGRRRREESEGAQLIYNGLRKYIAAFFNTGMEGLTPSDIKTLLENHDVDPETSSQITELVEHNFNTAYNGTAAPGRDIAQDCARALQALSLLDRRKQRQHEKK